MKPNSNPNNNGNVNNVNGNSGIIYNKKPNVEDQRYMQWLKNVQQELTSSNNNPNNVSQKKVNTKINMKNQISQKQSQSNNPSQSNRNKFIYVSQYEQPLKKTNSLLQGQTVTQKQKEKEKKQYLYTYDPTQQHKIKKRSQFELEKESQKRNKQQNVNVIPISHRRERSLSPIKTEENQKSQNLGRQLQLKSRNTPKVSLQYYSNKWSSPQIADFENYFVQKKQKEVSLSQFNSAQSKYNNNKSKIFGQSNSNYSSLKKSSISIVEGLQQKDEEYLKNVYPQTIKYLKDMIDTLSQDKNVLLEQKHRIKQEYFKAIEEKTQTIKNNLFKIVEEALQEWKQKQFKNIQKNQMKYLGELLQVEDMIEQRQKELFALQNRLQQDLRNYRQSDADINIRNTFSDILSGNHKDQIITLSKQLERAIQNTSQLSIKLTNQITKQQLSRQELNSLRQNIRSCFLVGKTQKKQEKQVGIIKSKFDQNKTKSQNNYTPNNSQTKSNNKRFLQQQEQKPTKIKKDESSKTLLKDYQKIYSDFRKDFDKRYQSFILQSSKQKQKQKNNTTASQIKAQKQKQKNPIKKASIYSQ